ncbi:MAG: hypothetical protein HY875_16650 [Chloroflexi bacterium]|nr:hypothetical protein [Chloroflexota bacterium]
MTRGVLLVGHGSHFNANSSAPVHAHAERLAGRLPAGTEIRTAFWKEEPPLCRGLDAFSPAVDDVTVVPVFIATGYFTEEVVPRELRITGPIGEVDGIRVRYTGAIGAHPSLAKVVVQRAMEAGATGREALAVLGHGTSRNRRSAENTVLQAEFVRRLGIFPEVTAVFLDQEPNMRAVFDHVAAAEAVMVPLFIADGWHVGETIPEDMALDGVSTVRDGRSLRFAAAAGTHPAIAGVIAEMVEEAWQWQTN